MDVQEVIFVSSLGSELAIHKTELTRQQSTPNIKQRRYFLRFQLPSGGMTTRQNFAFCLSKSQPNICPLRIPRYFASFTHMIVCHNTVRLTHYYKNKLVKWLCTLARHILCYCENCVFHNSLHCDKGPGRGYTLIMG